MRRFAGEPAKNEAAFHSGREAVQRFQPFADAVLLRNEPRTLFRALNKHAEHFRFYVRNQVHQPLVGTETVGGPLTLAFEPQLRYVGPTAFHVRDEAIRCATRVRAMIREDIPPERPCPICFGKRIPIPVAWSRVLLQRVVIAPQRLPSARPGRRSRVIGCRPARG